MTDLERTRILVRWSNVIGVQPFRVELDADTGKFRRFNFSWRHPVTWWFVVSTVLMAVIAWFVFDIYVTLQSSIYETESPTIAKVVYPILQLGSFLTIINPYMLIWRWKDLAEAVKWVHKFDRAVEDVGNLPCQTKRRILFGLLSTYALVSPQWIIGKLNENDFTCRLLARFRARFGFPIAFKRVEASSTMSFLSVTPLLTGKPLLSLACSTMCASTTLVNESRF